jgi:hypothetical protein
MRWLLPVIVILLTLSPTVAATILEPSWVEKYVNSYNSRVDGAPDILKKLLVGNERVNINIILNSGEIETVGFQTESSRITRTVPGGFDEPTIDIVATESAINNVRQATDPIEAFQTERDFGMVTVTGLTLATKFKVGGVLASISVLRFFAGIFFG